MTRNLSLQLNSSSLDLCASSPFVFFSFVFVFFFWSIHPPSSSCAVHFACRAPHLAASELFPFSPTLSLCLCLFFSIDSSLFFPLPSHIPLLSFHPFLLSPSTLCDMPCSYSCISPHFSFPFRFISKMSIFLVCFLFNFPFEWWIALPSTSPPSLFLSDVA